MTSRTLDDELRRRLAVLGDGGDLGGVGELTVTHDELVHRAVANHVILLARLDLLQFNVCDPGHFLAVKVQNKSAKCSQF